jgi:hypothetical protein
VPTTDQRQTISEAIKQVLPAESIDRIGVEDGIDSDGDPILKITIVLKHDMRLWDTKAMLGLTRHIREKIPDETRFPLIDFVSATDVARA